MSSVDIDELTLTMIASHMHLTIGNPMVAAIAYAARLGWSDVTCRAFVTALIMTNTLTDQSQWPVVLRKVQDLKIEADLAALEDGKTITRDIE